MTTDTTHQWSKVVVTGAGGWVGRNALELLSCSTIPEVVPLALSARRMQSAGRTVALQPIGVLPNVGINPRSLLLLSGFPTQDQVDAVGEPAYRRSIDDLRRLTLSVLEQGPADVIYLSSGAATSVERDIGVPPRTRVYGESKLEDERAYRSAVMERGGRLCVVRAFALSGRFMTKPETYALGNMILQAARSGSIEVKAGVRVHRSYTSIEDMLRIAMHAVSSLGPGETITFETAGEVVEVGDLAARVLDVMGLDRSRIERPRVDADAPGDDYLGSDQPLSDLARQADVIRAGLDDQIAVTADWLLEGGT